MHARFYLDMVFVFDVVLNKFFWEKNVVLNKYGLKAPHMCIWP